MKGTLAVTGDPAADELVNTDPLALLIGMILDQQIPLERAFHAPLELKERLGGALDAHEIAAVDPDRLAATFATQPALHRFPSSMATRVRDACQHLVDTYDGEAARLWHEAGDGADLLQRVKAVPGFGDQKARIFVALLAKRLGVQPPGWEQAAGDYAKEGTRSVADIDSRAALEQVRAYKREMKARAKPS